MPDDYQTTADAQAAPARAGDAPARPFSMADALRSTADSAPLAPAAGQDAPAAGPTPTEGDPRATDGPTPPAGAQPDATSPGEDAPWHTDPRFQEFLKNKSQFEELQKYVPVIEELKQRGIADGQAALDNLAQERAAAAQQQQQAQFEALVRQETDARQDAARQTEQYRQIQQQAADGALPENVALMLMQTLEDAAAREAQQAVQQYSFQRDQQQRNFEQVLGQTLAQDAYKGLPREMVLAHIPPGVDPSVPLPQVLAYAAQMAQRQAQQIGDAAVTRHLEAQTRAPAAAPLPGGGAQPSGAAPGPARNFSIGQALRLTAPDRA